MSGTILENLSTKKLSILVGVLMICQVVCFLIGGLVGKERVFNDICTRNLFDFYSAPIPASVQTILGTICKDVPSAYNDTTIWLYPRGDGMYEINN